MGGNIKINRSPKNFIIQRSGPSLSVWRECWLRSNMFITLSKLISYFSLFHYFIGYFFWRSVIMRMVLQKQVKHKFRQHHAHFINAMTYYLSILKRNMQSTAGLQKLMHLTDGAATNALLCHLYVMKFLVLPVKTEHSSAGVSWSF